MSDEPVGTSHVPEAPQPPAPAEKKPNSMSPNMSFRNKYAITDRVWVVFTNGPLLRVNEFEVKSFNAEIIGFDEPGYIYGFSINADGHEDSPNLTFIKESMCFRDKDSAEKHAQTLIGDLMAEYDKEIEVATKHFEKVIANLNDQKAKISANELTVPPREVQVPPQNPQEKVADEVTGVTHPSVPPVTDATPANTEEPDEAPPNPAENDDKQEAEANPDKPQA